MESTFTVLTQAMESAPFIAFFAAFMWGILSILLSPCHLAGIPLVIGYVAHQSNKSNKWAFGLSLSFALGVLATIIIIGITTTALGRMAGDLGPYANYIVAIVFIFMGLYLLGIIDIPWEGQRLTTNSKKGLLGAFLLGFIFGATLGPCAFAFMAPVLGVSFRVAANAPALSLLLLSAFAIGHCAVIVVAGTSATMTQNYLNKIGKSFASDLLRKFAGVCVVFAGLYLIYKA